MIRLPPRFTRTDPLFPSTTLFRSRAYVYASRDTNVPGFQQSARASAVLADYNSLFDRSQLLQLRFNGALYLGSLLLLALAVIAAIVVAARIVRPLGTLIGATRTAAEGDLSIRVTRPEERRVGKECVSTGKSRWWPYH